MEFNGYKEEPVPNEETIKAIEETVAIDKGLIKGKTYCNID